MGVYVCVRAEPEAARHVLDASLVRDDDNWCADAALSKSLQD
jgi:hypothetical protein